MQKVYKMSGSEGEIYRNARETVDAKAQHKITFIINAIESGWSVRKRNGSYIFSKKHEGRKEIFKETYLDTFINEML